MNRPYDPRPPRVLRSQASARSVPSSGAALSDGGTVRTADPFYERFGTLLAAAVEFRASEWPGRPLGKLDGETTGDLFTRGAKRMEGKQR